jgi:predicted NACHT family NTPase
MTEASTKPTPEPKPPNRSEQFAELILKAIMATGGVGCFWSLFISSDLPKAALSGVLALGAGYITTLMKPVHEGTSKRLEETGKALDQVIAKGLDRGVANLQSREHKYLAAIKVQCYPLDIEGYIPDQTLALDDVFVPLQVENPGLALHDRRSMEIWDFLSQQSQPRTVHRRIVIVAAPGYGKTTLLRHLAFTCAARPEHSRSTLTFFPIFLRLREIYKLIPEDAPQRLPDLIATHLSTKGEFRVLKLSRDWFEEQLQHKPCLVMLDGIDEVPKSQRSKVRKWVDQEMRAYQEAQFILTARPQGFELQQNQESVPIEIDLKLKVLDFTNEQKQVFIHKWYAAIAHRRWGILQNENRRKSPQLHLSEEAIQAQIKQEATDTARHLIQQLFASPALTDLAKNPLLITMISEIHRGQVDLPKRRIELYSKIFDVLLGTRPSVKGNQLSLTAEQNCAILQSLAIQLVQLDRTQFSLAEATPWIQDCLTRCAKDKPLEPQLFWEEMRDGAGILQEQELGVYEFAHQTFQEFLAAKQLYEEEHEALLFKQLTNDRWEEVICFYAALGNATSLMNAILDTLEQSSIVLSSLLLKLANRVKQEGREVDEKTLERYQQVSARVVAQTIDQSVQLYHSGDGLSAELLLERKFNNLIRLSNTTEILLDPITICEYQLFLRSQQMGQFHSQAQVINFPEAEKFQPVQDIDLQDANWFCAWLSTHPFLQSEQAVYRYRLPTPAEIRSLEALELDRESLCTDADHSSENTLHVVREVLPSQYRILLNYLASGCWQDADQETDRLMLHIAGQTEQGYLIPDDILKFPCTDLQILDQLWIRFSGGLFGFSVQKQIYMETGNPLSKEYHEANWYVFCDRTAWRKNHQYIDYPDDVTFALSAPKGHLPFKGFEVGIHGLLFSLTDTCNL